MKWKKTLLNSENVVTHLSINHDVISFRDYVCFVVFLGGVGGGVLRHLAVQTDFEFKISGPLIGMFA